MDLENLVEALQYRKNTLTLRLNKLDAVAAADLDAGVADLEAVPMWRWCLDWVWCQRMRVWSHRESATRSARRAPCQARGTQPAIMVCFFAGGPRYVTDDATDHASTNDVQVCEGTKFTTAGGDSFWPFCGPVSAVLSRAPLNRIARMQAQMLHSTEVYHR